MYITSSSPAMPTTTQRSPSSHPRDQGTPASRGNPLRGDAAPPHPPTMHLMPCASSSPFETVVSDVLFLVVTFSSVVIFLPLSSAADIASRLCLGRLRGGALLGGSDDVDVDADADTGAGDADADPDEAAVGVGASDPDPAVAAILASSTTSRCCARYLATSGSSFLSLIVSLEYQHRLKRLLTISSRLQTALAAESR